ncbi:MAG: replication protein O [Podoviridae sp. ctbh1]|nr:MAG: replication protein O [Podoviridae sp. ctbh1]
MLLWVISDIADDDGNTSWYAPRSRLMEETGYSRTTIALCISYLKECGILNVAGGNGRLNQYVVTPNNFNSAVKYEPKKYAKPVSEVDQSTKQTSQPSEHDQSATLTTPVNLATKPVSEVDTIHHSLIYPSVNPSLGDSENAPKVKAEPEVKRITKKQSGINKLVELGCDEKYAHDWMIARKGAELTDSILENLTEQAAKANISVATAVEWSAKKGYQGFKADWYQKDKQPQQNTGYTTHPKDINADYWASFGRVAQQQHMDDPIDVTPKKPNWIEGVGHA